MLYRSIEGTNTKTRRLAYLTSIVQILGKRDLSARQLLLKLVDWSQKHERCLQEYWVHTGEVTSTNRNSAGARYIELATNLGLIVPISGTYRVTRMGAVLRSLTDDSKSSKNPFFISVSEILFYLYLLLTKDADIILSIVDYLRVNPEANLAKLQRDFQESFLNRLGQKITASRDDKLKQILLDRISEVKAWQKPERYSEHIVPPRLNWLLDLEFCEPGNFSRHKYIFNNPAKRFLAALPMSDDGSFHDVTTTWLQEGFWAVAPSSLYVSTKLFTWEELTDASRTETCGDLLEQTFKIFRYTGVPKVSLSQALLFICLKLMVNNQLLVSPQTLSNWLLVPRIIRDKRYEVRLSPRENESYLVMMPARRDQ